MEQVQAPRRTPIDVILDCISDGVITIDLDKRITFINEAMRHMLGYGGEVPDHLRPCDVLVHHSLCNTDACVLERALHGERVTNDEAFLRSQDGHLLPVSIRTDFLHDDQGRLVGLVEVIRDLSVSKELSSKMVEVHELKQRLGEHALFEDMVGRNPRKREMFSRLPSVQQSSTSVEGFTQAQFEPMPAGALKAVEHDVIIKVLEGNGWRYKAAAEQLGISRSTLWRKLKRLGLQRSQPVLK